MIREPVIVTGVNLPSASYPPGQRPPLGLGMVMANARKVLGADDRFDVATRFANSEDEAKRILDGPGRHVFLYSDYMWSSNDNLELSRRLKSYRPDVVNVHGGPNVPSFPEKCEEYLRREVHVDFAVRGEGELVLIDLLRAIAEGGAREAIIPNVATLVHGRFVQHPMRERPSALDEFPSPYLDGTFDPLEPERWLAGIVETNRGCPYGCTFCDWGAATLQKIRTFDLARVRAEVEWLAARRIPNLWWADANFGILPRDVEIAKIVVETKKKYGFPNVLITAWAKNTQKHLIEIIEMYVEAGLVSNGIVSLQTRDPSTLAIIRRKNIKTSEYDKLRSEFQRRGLPLGAQLMIGLPGATLQAMKDDLAHYFDDPIEVQMFRTVLLPNAPMAEPSYMAAHEIAHRPDGLVVSTKTMSESDYITATFLARAFSVVHHFGVLRYVVVFLQREHGIAPLDLLQELAASEAELRARYPLLHLVLIPDGDVLYLFESPAELFERCRSKGLWHDLTEELFAFVRERHGISRTAAWDAVCAAQTAVMPAAGRSYPHVEPLEHDVVSWYAAGRSNEHRPLAGYGPGTLVVEDPLGWSSREYVHDRKSRWALELASALARARVGGAPARGARPIAFIHPEVALPWPVGSTLT